MTASTTRRPTATRSRLAAVGAIAVAGTLLLTGCGDQTKAGGSADSAAAKAPLFSKLPKEIQNSGVVKVGSDISYPPVENMVNDKAVGSPAC